MLLRRSVDGRLAGARFAARGEAIVFVVFFDAVVVDAVVFAAAAPLGLSGRDTGGRAIFHG